MISTVELVERAEREVADLALRHDACIVSFSGGKDSCCLAQMAYQHFRRVVLMYMYFIPGLRCEETKLDFARKRWNADIVQYPHWQNFRDLKGGRFCPVYSIAINNLPELKLPDIYNLARKELGIDLILRGGKKSDSQWRRRMLNAKGNNKNVVDPLRDWHRYEVLYYLSVHGIPLPDGEGNGKSTLSGVGLTTNAICWLHDLYPDDYAKVRAVFPFIPAVIYRRKWFGHGEYYDKELQATEEQERLNGPQTVAG